MNTAAKKQLLKKVKMALLDASYGVPIRLLMDELWDAIREVRYGKVRKKK